MAGKKGLFAADKARRSGRIHADFVEIPTAIPNPAVRVGPSRWATLSEQRDLPGALARPPEHDEIRVNLA